MRCPPARFAILIALAVVFSGCAAAPDSAPTPSPPPTSTPSATLTPTLDPAGVAAFGGDCAETLSASEVTDLLGVAMTELAAPWSPQADHRLGGVQCSWTTSESFMGARLNVFVYPAEAVDAIADDPDVAGCDESFGWVDCATSRYSGDLWVWVNVGLPADAGSDVSARVADTADSVVSLVAERAAAFPPAYAAARTADWWQIADCHEAIETLVASGALPPGSRVDERWGLRTGPWALTQSHGLSLGCESVHDGEDGELVPTFFMLFPGGGSAMDSAASTEWSEAVTVPGASAALVAPSLDAIEGHTPLLVVTDGPNLLAVPIDFEGLSEQNIALAAALLAGLAGT